MKTFLENLKKELEKRTKYFAINVIKTLKQFNVSGIDGLQKELTRLKEIGKNPHDIFTEGNYR